jgi:parallel beta-helix repeat protein
MKIVDVAIDAMNRKLVLMLTVTLLVGTLGLAFNVQKAKASGTIYIRADGSIEPTTANMTSFDNTTYIFTDNNYDSIVVQKSNILIDGKGYTLQGLGEGTGFSLYGVENVTIKTTHIRGFLYSIYLSVSFGNMISGNNITANSYFGICVYESSHNSIFGNNITANGGGIWLGSSSDNIIDQNNLTDSNAGISIGADGSSNKIEGNNITNNLRGIEYLGDGSNNIFDHNNFVNNTQQVFSLGLPNVWDDGYPSGGNYWSDYNGTDANHDGIGDTPYIVDENNTDNYPIMAPTVIPEFPSFFVALLFIVTMLPATIVYRRRHLT